MARLHSEISAIQPTSLLGDAIAVLALILLAAFIVRELTVPSSSSLFSSVFFLMTAGCFLVFVTAEKELFAHTMAEKQLLDWSVFMLTECNLTFEADSSRIPRMCCCSTCANLFTAAAVAVIYKLAAAFFYIITFCGLLLTAACTCHLVPSSS